MKPLTKSLHTITAVTRVAMHLRAMHPASLPGENLAKRALLVLGYTHKDYALSDETYQRCIVSIKKAIKDDEA